MIVNIIKNLKVTMNIKVIFINNNIMVFIAHINYENTVFVNIQDNKIGFIEHVKDVIFLKEVKMKGKKQWEIKRKLRN